MFYLYDCNDSACATCVTAGYLVIIIWTPLFVVNFCSCVWMDRFFHAVRIFI